LNLADESAQSEIR